jgi:adenosylcobinamide-GDP ribazoletransferase
LTAADTVRAGALRRTGAGLALAIAFLTIVPVRVPARPRVELGSAAGWFPVVGALIGAAAGGVRAGMEPLIGATAATVLALVALVALTGALHQDGLADVADGLGVRGDRERRLAVMRDPVTGTFGTLALIGWALLMLAALAPLRDDDALAALIAAGALSRWAALVHASFAPAARTGGLGAGFVVSQAALVVATACAVTVALLVAGPGPGAAAVGATVVLAALSALAARRLIGGRTGDTIGATVCVVEAAVATLLLGFFR